MQKVVKDQLLNSNGKKMSYIFFGTPEFAAIILDKLLKAGLPPLALVCNPDRPVGRKKVLTPPATKAVVINCQLLDVKCDILVLQPEKLDAEFLSKLRSLNADFYIVAAYAKILKKELIDIPPLGVIGVHPSLLPKYRGSSPIQSAILNQEKETGVDLFMIDEGIDHGPIIASQKLNIEGRNYKELEKELAELAAKMLIETLPKFVKKEITPIPQDDSEATYTKKFKTEDGFIDYKDLVLAEEGDPNLANHITAKIKALNPEPGVYTINKDGKRIKLLSSEVKDNKLILKEIQYEGKNPIFFNSKL